MNKRQRKKYAKQHGTYVDYKETWSLDCTIAKFIIPRLKLYKKVINGYPGRLNSVEQWYEILDKINERKYGYSTLIDNMEYDNGLMSFSYAYTGDKNGYRVAVYDNKSKSAWNYAFVSDEQIACACMHESMIYVFTQTPDGQTRLYRIPFVKDAIHQLKE